MKIRRHIVYTSINYSADFLAYYDGKKLVALVVEGRNLSINGKVDAETFKTLLRMVKEAEAERRDPWEGKRVATYRDPSCGRSSEAVLPRANMRDVFVNACGMYDRRWIR